MNTISDWYNEPVIETTKDLSKIFYSLDAFIGIDKGEYSNLQKIITDSENWEHNITIEYIKKNDALVSNDDLGFNGKYLDHICKVNYKGQPFALTHEYGNWGDNFDCWITDAEIHKEATKELFSLLINEVRFHQYPLDYQP